MKEIKAVVQPSRLLKIRSAFRHVKDFPGMTITKVEGCSRSAQHERKSIREELTEFSPKVRIEIVAPDDMVEGILQVLVEVSSTGQRGCRTDHRPRMKRTDPRIRMGRRTGLAAVWFNLETPVGRTHPIGDASQGTSARIFAALQQASSGQLRFLGSNVAQRAEQLPLEILVQ